MLPHAPPPATNSVRRALMKGPDPVLHPTSLRRVCRDPRPARAYGQQDKSTDKTTAATPLPGWPRAIEQKRRRQTPSKPSYPMRTTVILPCDDPAASTIAMCDTPILAAAVIS